MDTIRLVWFRNDAMTVGSVGLGAGKGPNTAEKRPATDLYHRASRLVSSRLPLCSFGIHLISCLKFQALFFFLISFSFFEFQTIINNQLYCIQ